MGLEWGYKKEEQGSFSGGTRDKKKLIQWMSSKAPMSSLCVFIILHIGLLFQSWEAG